MKQAHSLQSMPTGPSGGRIARALVQRWARRLRISGPGWRELSFELDRWPRGGAIFWWRDDDAVTETQALERLLALRDALRLPLGLAVIPATAKADLAARLGEPEARDVRVLVHGWDHRNAARPGRPAGELCAERDPKEVANQLTGARLRLAELFPRSAMPILVPPFNHLAARLVRSVRRAGFSHVSIDRDFPGLAMPSRNVHADVIDWTRRTAAQPADLARAVIIALRLRRYGLVGKEAPIGVLTHHLVHDDAVWSVTRELLERLAGHHAARFSPLPEIFA